MPDPARATDPLSVDELRVLAKAIGLERLSDDHLAQLGRAIAALRRHLDRLPRDLPPDAEPAVAFRPIAPAE